MTNGRQPASPAGNDTKPADVEGALDFLTKEPEAPDTGTAAPGDDPGSKPDQKAADQPPPKPDEKPEPTKDEGDEAGKDKATEKAEPKDEPKKPNPIEDALDLLTTPESELTDDRWRELVPKKTAERFDKLTNDLKEAKAEAALVAPLREALKGTDLTDEVIQQSIARHVELYKDGIDQDSIDFGHNMIRVLNADPKGEGYKLLMNYVRAHEKAYDIEGAAPADGASAPDLSKLATYDGELPEELRDAVEYEVIPEEEARLLAAYRASKSKPKQEAPTPPPAPAKEDPPPTQKPEPAPTQAAPQPSEAAALIGKFLHDETGLDGDAAVDFYEKHILGRALAAVREDGLDVATLPAKAQLRYVRAALAEAQKDGVAVSKKGEGAKRGEQEGDTYQPMRSGPPPVGSTGSTVIDEALEHLTGYRPT